MPRDAEPSDEELMSLYRDGDAAAFDTLYARHRGGVYRYLLRQCRDAATAEELFQDVWMNLIRARARYTVRAKFTTYLYHLAHNRLIDHFRRHDPRVAVSLEEEGVEAAAVQNGAEDPAPAPEEALDDRRRAARLLELVAQLPAPQREAFLLQQEGGLTVEAIARATGVTRETAKSRLRYAMSKLREGMRA